MQRIKSCPCCGKKFNRKTKFADFVPGCKECKHYFIKYKFSFPL